MALAVCLMLCHTVYAFAAVPVLPMGYNESGKEESKNSKPLIELEPEEFVEPESELKEATELELEAEKPDEPSIAPDLPEPQEDEGLDMVSDETELAAWIEQHKETGGTVLLGANITITKPMAIYYIKKKVTIDTGKYGLLFDGNTLPTSNLLITGEGVDMPVVDVRRAGGDSPRENSWNNTLLELNVTATGRDGKGGIALRILAADTKAISMDALREQGMIRSYGEGAIGLWLDVPMDAWCYQVEVFGDYNKAVYAPNGTDLTYCKLTAEGNGASAVAGNGLRLDSCVASPTPSGVRSVNRRAMEESFSRLYLPLMQNEDERNFIQMLNMPTVFLHSDDDIIAQPFAVYWDMGTYYNIDTSILGKTIISGTVAPALYDLGVFDDVPIELTVEVRDPDLPCISRIAIQKIEGNWFATLNFFQDYNSPDKSVILWRSDDEGETWWDTTHSPDISWGNGVVDFHYDELEHPIWFQLEIIGAGESNISILDEKDGVFIGGNGGDRTGTDREGAGPVGGGTPDNSDEPSSNHPDGGNSGSPEGSEGVNGGGGTSENSTPTDGGQPNSGTIEKNDMKGNVQPRQNSTNANVLNPSPVDVAPWGVIEKNIPARKQVLAASAPVMSVQENPPADARPPTDEDAEKMQPSMAIEALSVIEEPPIFDSGRAAPKPKFSASSWAVFCLSAAALCFGLLLLLRSDWLARWRHGKK